MAGNVDTTTPRVCDICGKTCKGDAGLGGHRAWHNRQNKLAAKSKRKPARDNANKRKVNKPRKQKPQQLDAVDICSTVLQAITPNGVPVNKMAIWYRWVHSTQIFLEEMNG